VSGRGGDVAHSLQGRAGARSGGGAVRRSVPSYDTSSFAPGYLGASGEEERMAASTQGRGPVVTAKTRLPARSLNCGLKKKGRKKEMLGSHSFGLPGLADRMAALASRLRRQQFLWGTGGTVPYCIPEDT